VLNLLLSGLFVGAGLLESAVNDPEISLSPLRRTVRATELTTRDLRELGRFLKQNNFVSKYYWELLSPETRQGFNAFLLTVRRRRSSRNS